MKKVKLWLKFEDTEEIYDLQAEFSDEEIDLLKEFLNHVLALQVTKVISENFPASINVTWNPDSVTNVQAPELDSEYINSFLHKLRFLILSDERTSFSQVTALVKRKFNNPGMDRQIKAYWRKYTTSTFSRYGQITIDNIPVFNDDTLRLWLNAYEYHGDKPKKERLRYIESQFSAEGAKKLFVWQLRDKANAIFLFADFVKEIVEHD